MEAEWSYGDLKFIGLSLSGIHTSITYPQLRLCFDVAQGLPFCLGMKTFFITHGHLDHAAGIPYIVSQKALHNEAPPVFYMPEAMIGPMTAIMQNWQILEGHTYNLKFHAMNPGEKIWINPQAYVEAFPTIHRVPSQGYALYSQSKKLMAEFANLGGHQIRDLKAGGRKVEETVDTCLFAFTGDTQIEFLDLHPAPSTAKVLFIETTYIDDKKSIEHAKKWGHIHLDELIPRLDSIKCERIVLKHISSRYSTRYAEKMIREKIPPAHRERVVILPGR